MTKLTNGKQTNRSNSVDRGEPAASKHARELIEFCVQETRYSLILDMLAHPQRMPSFEELRKANPNRSPSTLSGHLEKLVKWGVVNRFKPPAGERSGSSPRNFYAVSSDGYAFLDHHNLIPEDEERLQDQYAGIEKPDEIVQLENYPRDNLVLDEDSIDSAERRLLRTIVEQYPVKNESSQSTAQRRVQEKSDTTAIANAVSSLSLGSQRKLITSSLISSENRNTDGDTSDEEKKSLHCNQS